MIKQYKRRFHEDSDCFIEDKMQNPKGKKMIDEDILTAEVLTDLVDEENTTKEKMETKQIEEEIKRLEERIRKLEERHRKITTYDTLKLKKHN